MVYALIALVSIAVAVALLPPGSSAPATDSDRGHWMVKREAQEFGGEGEDVEGGPPGRGGQSEGGNNSGRNHTRRGGPPGRQSGGLSGSCSSGRNRTSGGQRSNRQRQRGPPSSRLTDGTSQNTQTTIVSRHTSTDTNLKTGEKKETRFENMRDMKSVDGQAATESPDTEYSESDDPEE